MGLLREILSSPWSILVRGIYSAVACLIILGVFDMTTIDVAQYSLPDEFIPAMLAFALVAGLLSALYIRRVLHNRAADNKVANGTIPNTNSLPYDPKYDLMTCIGFVIGVAAAVFVTPVIVDTYIVNAGMWTHALISGVASLLLTAFAVYALQNGIRVALLDTAKYAVDTAEGVKEAAGILSIFKRN